MASHLLIAPLRAGLRLQQRINTPLTIPAFKRCLATNATTSPLHLALSTTTRAPIPPIGTYSRHLISKLRSESAAVVQFSRTLPSPVRNKYYGSTRSGGGSSKGFGGGGGFFSNLGRYIDRLPSNVIFYGILAVNGAVFLLWNYATETFKNSGDSSILIWMYKNFTSSLGNLKNGRVWTLLTSCFSHADTGHIVMNLINFALMAGGALELLGNARFLALYLGGGIVSSVISLAYGASTGAYNRQAHGASGAIFAIIAFYATLAPTSKFLLFAVVPIPAWLFVAGSAAIDIYGALGNPNRRVDGAGHLGGMLAGFLYARRLMRRF